MYSLIGCVRRQSRANKRKKHAPIINLILSSANSPVKDESTRFCGMNSLNWRIYFEMGFDPIQRVVEDLLFLRFVVDFME